MRCTDLAKKRLITPDHQEYLKTLIDNNRLEAYPKLQSCLLQSYILITGELFVSCVYSITATHVRSTLAFRETLLSVAKYKYLASKITL